VPEMDGCPLTTGDYYPALGTKSCTSKAVTGPKKNDCTPAPLSRFASFCHIMQLFCQIRPVICHFFTVQKYLGLKHSILASDPKIGSLAGFNFRQ